MNGSKKIPMIDWQSNWQPALKLFWAWFWRSTLIGMAALMVLSLVLGILEKEFQFLKAAEIKPFIYQLGSLAVYAIAGISAFKLLLDKRLIESQI